MSSKRNHEAHKRGPNDVRLPDSLMAALKDEAYYSGRTVRQIVIDTLKPIAEAAKEKKLLRLKEAGGKLSAYLKQQESKRSPKEDLS